MRRVMSTNKWSCLPCAFACAMEVELKDILDYLGHDGSRILCMGVPEPFNRRSFHIEEMVEFAWTRGFAVVHFEFSPMIQSCDSVDPTSISTPMSNAEKKLKLHDRCVLGGMQKYGIRHALAWDGVNVYDSKEPEIKDLIDFYLTDMWAIIKSNHTVECG